MGKLQNAIEEILVQHLKKKNKGFSWKDLDSLDYIEIMLALEEAFQIAFQENEIKQIRGFNDLLQLVEQKVGEENERA